MPGRNFNAIRLAKRLSRETTMITDEMVRLAAYEIDGVYCAPGLNTPADAENAARAALTAALAASPPSPPASAPDVSKAADLAIFAFLLNECSYSYGEGQPPSPPEMGIAWGWQASTTERPTLYDQLAADAFAYFDRYVNEMDPGDVPTDWDRECMARREALASLSNEEGGSPRREKSIAELQAEIGRLQSALHRRVLGDQSVGVSFPSEAPDDKG